MTRDQLIEQMAIAYARRTTYGGRRGYDQSTDPRRGEWPERYPKGSRQRAINMATIMLERYEEVQQGKLL